MRDDELNGKSDTTTRPWIVLDTTYDVEAWIDSFNRDLQKLVGNGNAYVNPGNGYGICFTLTEGGDIYLHTTSEGDVVLDVTPDAEWVTPLIEATTRTEGQNSQIWNLPGHTLTQLVLGLSSLIASTRMVANHDFRIRKY